MAQCADPCTGEEINDEGNCTVTPYCCYVQGRCILHQLTVGKCDD